MSELTLRQLGENALVERLTAGLPLSSRTVIGPGDDCAVLRGPEQWQVFKTDCIVERVHFLPETPGALVGRKAICRGLSDLAAMGATPAEAVITLGAPADTLVSRVEAIYAGLRAAGELYGCGIVGGETVALPRGSALFLNVALLGLTPPQQCLTRSGASPGDVLFVSGELGNTLASEHHLHFEPRLALGQFLAQSGLATAAMDLSDGLGVDLPRLAAASGCSFHLVPADLPCRSGATAQQALSDGEDYELLFTARETEVPNLLAEWAARFPQIRLTRIGKMLPLDKAATQLAGGWQHFSQ
jgi:thiamine-monophosphate kinase